jgi:hypothetical protein
MLGFELFPARHRDHRRGYVLLGQQALRCKKGDLDLGSGGKQRDVTTPVRLLKDIGSQR